MPTLYASFSDLSTAEAAVGDLLDHGVAGRDIHLVANRRQATKARADIDHDHASSGVTSATPSEEPHPAVGERLKHGLEALFSVVVRGVGMLIGEAAAGGTVADAIDDLEHQSIEGTVATYFEQQGVPTATALVYEQTVAAGGMVLAIDLEAEKQLAVIALLDSHEGQSYTWDGAVLERPAPVEPPPAAEAPLVADPVAAMLGHPPTTEQP